MELFAAPHLMRENKSIYYEKVNLDSLSRTRIIARLHSATAAHDNR